MVKEVPPCERYAVYDGRVPQIRLSRIDILYIGRTSTSIERWQVPLRIGIDTLQHGYLSHADRSWRCGQYGRGRDEGAPRVTALWTTYRLQLTLTVARSCARIPSDSGTCCHEVRGLLLIIPFLLHCCYIVPTPYCSVLTIQLQPVVPQVPRFISDG